MVFDFLKRKEQSKISYLHVAIDIKGVPEWCEKNKVSLEDGYLRSITKIKEIIKLQIEEQFPILSFLILPLEKKDNPELLKIFKEFLEGDFFLDFLNQNKIKVTLLGKWYDLPTEILDSLKRIVEETKMYDNFFLNFCLNYDGQIELLDAFKILVRQVMSGKLSADNITQETIKENIYSSYFIPPDLIVHNHDKTAGSFFLWDSTKAKRIFTKKDFPDFDVKIIDRVLKRIIEYKTPADRRSSLLGKKR